MPWRSVGRKSERAAQLRFGSAEVLPCFVLPFAMIGPMIHASRLVLAFAAEASGVGLTREESMTEEKEGDSNLIRVKADTTGLDLAIDRSFPKLIGRLLPARLRLRKGVDNAITEQIVGKLTTGTALNDAELAFAEGMLSDAAVKYLRLARIQERAQQLCESEAVPLLMAPQTPNCEEPPTATTSSDWLNRFREDASLVDDEVLSEIYARVLSTEERAPGAFTLRSLGVLRYMDREAATAFGTLLQVLVDGSIVPMQSTDKNHVLHTLGLNHSTMLMLDDAGLVNSSANSSRTIETDAHFYKFTGHGQILHARKKDHSKFTVELHVHLLTPAGRQLARIAQCEPSETAFNALLSWLKQSLGDVELFAAQLPSRNWVGPANQLQWRAISADAAQLTHEPASQVL